MQNPYFVDQRPRRAPDNSENNMFKEFDATELYCPKCGRATPVRKRLLLVLPEGDKYEYLCRFCSTSVGSKISKETDRLSIIA
jgi:hypothetical protein